MYATPIQVFRWGEYEDLLARCSIALDLTKGKKWWIVVCDALLKMGKVLFGLERARWEIRKPIKTTRSPDTVEEMEQQLDTLLQQPETYKENW